MTSNEINVDEIKSALSGCYVHNIPLVFVTIVYDHVNEGTNDYHVKERLVLGKVKEIWASSSIDDENCCFHIPLTEFKRHVKNNTRPSHYDY